MNARPSIYENLRDLQFEYRLGKMSDDDYQRSKTDLQKELARVMAEVEKSSRRPANQDQGRILPCRLEKSSFRMPQLQRRIPERTEVLWRMRQIHD